MIHLNYNSQKTKRLNYIDQNASSLHNYIRVPPQHIHASLTYIHSDFLDSDASGTYVMICSAVTDMHPAMQPINVHLPNGASMESTH